jgi:uncharacterized protein YjbJ (UPF0337 family)
LQVQDTDNKSKEEFIMGSTEDKIRGSVNDAIGAVKTTAGEATDNEELQQEGEGQQVKGKAQKLLGDAKDIVGDAAESLSNAVKKSGD